jgi:hypothetical protein
MKLRKRNLIRSLLLLCVLTPALAGCKEDPVMLGIVGYNYTDRYIDTFAVDGAGGGNVMTSTLTSGGGGTVCCAVYDPNYPLPITMKVEWMFGYQRGENGRIVVPDEHHETFAVLDGPVPEDPAYLEVHFMPDGNVQLRMTAAPSPPLMLIDRPGSEPALPAHLP